MQWPLKVILISTVILVQGYTGLASSNSYRDGSKDGEQQQTQSPASQPEDVPLTWNRLFDVVLQSKPTSGGCDLCSSVRGEGSVDKHLCFRCLSALYNDPESVQYHVTYNVACGTCLTAPSKSVTWSLKDDLAGLIARALFDDYLADYPAETKKERFPCVSCMLFFLEQTTPWDMVYYHAKKLSQCRQCRDDTAMDEDVHTFVNYRLASYYLKTWIPSGLPYANDHSQLGKFYRLLTWDPTNIRDPAQEFFVTFLQRPKLVGAVVQRYTEDGRHVAVTTHRKLSTAVLKALLYGPSAHAKTVATGTASKPESVVTGSNPAGASASADGKTKPASAGSAAKPPGVKAKSSKEQARPGSIKHLVQQPIIDNSDMVIDLDLDYDVYRDAYNTPVDYPQLAAFGIAFVIVLLIMPAFWYRYCKPSSREGRRGRRAPRQLSDILSHVSHDIVTLLSYVVRPTYAVIHFLFSGQGIRLVTVCLATFVSCGEVAMYVDKLPADEPVYACDILAAKWPVLATCFLVVACVCFYRQLWAATCQGIAWCMSGVCKPTIWLKGLSIAAFHLFHGKQTEEPVQGAACAGVLQPMYTFIRLVFSRKAIISALACFIGMLLFEYMLVLIKSDPNEYPPLDAWDAWCVLCPSLMIVCLGYPGHISSAASQSSAWCFAGTSKLLQWVKDVYVDAFYVCTDDEQKGQPAQAAAAAAVVQEHQPATTKHQPSQQQRNSKGKKGRYRSSSVSSSSNQASCSSSKAVSREASSDGRALVSTNSTSSSSTGAATLDEADLDPARAVSTVSSVDSSSKHCLEALTAADAAVVVGEIAAGSAARAAAVAEQAAVPKLSGLETMLAAADALAAAAEASMPKSKTANATPSPAAGAGGPSNKGSEHSAPAASATSSAAAAAAATAPVSASGISAVAAAEPKAHTAANTLSAAQEAWAAATSHTAAMVTPAAAAVLDTVGSTKPPGKTAPAAAASAAAAAAPPPPPPSLAAAAAQEVPKQIKTQTPGVCSSDNITTSGKGRANSRNKQATNQQVGSPSPSRQPTAAAAAAIAATATMAMTAGKPSTAPGVSCAIAGNSLGKAAVQKPPVAHHHHHQRQQQQQQRQANAASTASSRNTASAVKSGQAAPSIRAQTHSSSSSSSMPVGGTGSKLYKPETFASAGRQQLSQDRTATAAAVDAVTAAAAGVVGAPDVAVPDCAQQVAGLQCLGSGSNSSSSVGLAPSQGLYAAPYRPLQYMSSVTATSSSAVTAAAADEGPPLSQVVSINVAAGHAASPVLLAQPILFNSAADAPAGPHPAVPFPSLAAAVAAEPAAAAAAGDGDHDGELGCVICWDNDRTWGLLHDGDMHLCLCDDCAAVYDYAKLGCPMCRRPVDDIVRLNLSVSGNV